MRSGDKTIRICCLSVHFIWNFCFLRYANIQILFEIAIFSAKNFPRWCHQASFCFRLCSCAEASSSRLLIPLVHTFALIHLFGLHDFSRRTHGILSKCANLWQRYYVSNMLLSLSGCFLRLYVLLDFSDIAIFSFSRSTTLHSSI